MRDHGLSGVFLALVFVAAVLFGGVLVVDAFAFLAGLGTEVTVHVDGTSTGYYVQDPVVYPLVTHTGTYLDAAGAPHTVDVWGADLGDVVATRLPVIAPSLMPTPATAGTAVGDLLFGLLVVGFACRMAFLVLEEG